MNNKFPSTVGEEITLIEPPDNDVIDEWIYVAYLKTKHESPMGNEIGDALASFRDSDTRDGLLNEVRAYIDGRLAAHAVT